MLIVGIAAVTRAGSDPDRSVSSDASTPSAVDAPPPTGPIGFPVLLGIPEGVDDPVEPSAAYSPNGLEIGRGSSLSQDRPAEPGVTALVGRTSPTGVSDVIKIDAWPAEPNGMGELTEDDSRSISVAGRRAIVGPYDRPMDLTEARQLIFPGEPTLRVTGKDVIDFIEANPTRFGPVRSYAPGVSLDIAGFPDDLTVLRLRLAVSGVDCVRRCPSAILTLLWSVDRPLSLVRFSANGRQRLPSRRTGLDPPSATLAIPSTTAPSIAREGSPTAPRDSCPSPHPAGGRRTGHGRLRRRSREVALVLRRFRDIRLVDEADWRATTVIGRPH